MIIRYVGTNPCSHNGRIVMPGDTIESDGSHLLGHQHALWQAVIPVEVIATAAQDGSVGVTLTATNPLGVRQIKKPAPNSAVKKDD